jgi:hypothetical protein
VGGLDLEHLAVLLLLHRFPVSAGRCYKVDDPQAAGNDLPMNSEPSMPPSPVSAQEPFPAGGRATRLLRAAVVAVVVFGVEWRMADPHVIAVHPQLWPLPLSMLFMMVPVALGVWAYEAVAEGNPGFKVDLLRGILGGTLGYVALSLALRLS